MNIGLLEDNPAICDYVKTALELIGHKVFAHTTGLSFLEKLSSVSEKLLSPYEIVIIDLHLPGNISGQDVITTLRSTTSLADLPILVISGSSELELARIKACFPSIDILHKPFKLQALFQFVNQYCTVQ